LAAGFLSETIHKNPVLAFGSSCPYILIIKRFLSAPRTDCDRKCRLAFFPVSSQSFLLEPEGSMARHLPWTLLALTLGAGMPVALGEPKKSDPKANEVEARFADGSAVRMQVLQEALDIETRYGKLTVPINEIRRIEFATRISDETTKKIAAAIKRLGDSAYDQRQAASNELLEIGAPAYPALQIEAKSKDAEAARRARELIAHLRDKVPASQLRFVADDQVQTVKFTIVGRILSPTIKARSPYFNEVQLQIIDLRAMRWQGVGGESELAVDAAKYGSVPNTWMETEITVNTNDRLAIVASGQVDLWPPQPGGYMTGPSGYRQGGGQGMYLSGTLLGRIGEHGKVFAIGASYEGTPAEDGKLYLHIVPSPWNNASSGSYTVKVTTAP
jgi:hypothetical protein